MLLIITSLFSLLVAFLFFNKKGEQGAFGRYSLIIVISLFLSIATSTAFMFSVGEDYFSSCGGLFLFVDCFVLGFFTTLFWTVPFYMIIFLRIFGNKRKNKYLYELLFRSVVVSGAPVGLVAMLSIVNFERLELGLFAGVLFVTAYYIIPFIVTFLRKSYK